MCGLGWDPSLSLSKLVLLVLHWRRDGTRQEKRVTKRRSVREWFSIWIGWSWRRSVRKHGTRKTAKQWFVQTCPKWLVGHVEPSTGTESTPAGRRFWLDRKIVYRWETMRIRTFVYRQQDTLFRPIAQTRTKHFENVIMPGRFAELVAVLPRISHNQENVMSRWFRDLLANARSTRPWGEIEAYPTRLTLPFSATHINSLPAFETKLWNFVLSKSTHQQRFCCFLTAQKWKWRQQNGFVPYLRKRLSLRWFSVLRIDLLSNIHRCRCCPLLLIRRKKDPRYVWILCEDLVHAWLKAARCCNSNFPATGRSWISSASNWEIEKVAHACRSFLFAGDVCRRSIASNWFISFKSIPVVPNETQRRLNRDILNYGSFIFINSKSKTWRHIFKFKHEAT